MAEPVAAVAIIDAPDAVTRFRAADVANSALEAVQPGITQPTDDNLIDVGALCRMFEESEESTWQARQYAERDRDYVDNIQLTSEELSTLEKRGQPPMVDNRIKTKVDYLVGLEKQQRIDPRALPRTPIHEQDADGASQGIKYVADTEDYDSKRSGVWRNLLVEGAGGIGVSIEEGYSGVEIRIRRYAWDRIFWDPHSSELDFSDAGYLGVVVWMDIEDAKTRYPDGHDILETTLRSAPSDTYDDKPKYSLWADKKRKRVRVCQIWLRRDNAWHFAEFTKGGILIGGPSPYVNDKGESDCELFFQSAYVNRDNERYGLVREMITLQDGINKYHSKALHQLNTVQILTEEGVLQDPQATQRQAARPDGMIILAPGGMEKFKFNTRTDLATGQVQLAQELKNAIDLKGPNATQMGDKAQGSQSASGRAILASQQGGMVSLGDLLDNLRHLDKRVFRAVWSRIRQFWTQEKWIRVTDDERNVKWVAMNVDPMQLEMLAQQNPDMASKISGVVASVAELDCDIIIDEVPDSVTPALEQWQGLVELAKAGVAIPPKTLVMSAPNLKNKDKLIEEMEQASQTDPMAAAAQQLQLAAAQAKVQLDQMTAALREAQTQKTLVEAQLAPAEFAQDQQEKQEARQERFAMKGADIETAREARQEQRQREPV